MSRTTLVAAGIAIAVGVAVATIGSPGHAASDRSRLLYLNSATNTSASCRPDRRINVKRPVVKVYTDPLGDAVAGHTDFVRFRVSDLRGVVTFKIDVKKFRQGLMVLDFMGCGDGPDPMLDMQPNGTMEWAGDQGFVALPPASISRNGTTSTYMFRFSSSRLGIATAFYFSARAGMRQWMTFSDLAPNSALNSRRGWYYYDVLSR